MRGRKIGALLLFAALAGCANVPKSQDGSPPETTLEAAEVNPTTLAAAERGKQARLAEVAARSDLLPEVALLATATTYHQSSANTNPRSDSSGIGVELSLPISRAIAAVAGVKVASANSSAEEEVLRGSKNAVLVRIARAVAGLQRSRQIAHAKGQHLAQLRAFLNEQRGRQKAGAVSRTDLEQIKGRIAFSRAEVTRAKADVADAEGRLASLAGGAPPDALKLIDPRPLVPASAGKAVDLAMTDNPKVREETWRRRSASQNVGVATVNAGPEASVAVNFGSPNDGFTSSNTSSMQDTTVQFRLRVPLFDGGRRYSNVRGKVSELRETHYNLLAVRQDVEADTRAFWHQVNAANKSLKFASQRRVAAERSLRGVRKARRVGARSTQDELDAHRELVEAKIYEAEAKYNTLVFGHELLAQMGRLGRAYNLADRG